MKNGAVLKGLQGVSAVKVSANEVEFELAEASLNAKFALIANSHH
jgi:hypothetical protein